MTSTEKINRTKELIWDLGFPLAFIILASIVVGCIWHQTRPITTSNLIKDEMVKTDAIDTLKANSITLGYPGNFENARFNVVVENTSNQPQHLGFQYYAYGGKIMGIMPPRGHIGEATVNYIPPNWRRTLPIPSHLPKLERNSYIEVLLAQCSTQDIPRLVNDPKKGRVSMLPSGVNIFFEKQYTFKPKE